MIILKQINNFAVRVSSFTDSIFPNLQKKNLVLFIFYRSVLHILGSVILIIVTHNLSFYTFKSLPLIVFILLLVYIFYKEIIFDPKYYNQKAYKGVIDVAMWVLPFLIYFLH